MKRIVKQSIDSAKKIESIPFPKKEEIVELYSHALTEAKMLNKLLKPRDFPVMSKTVKKSTTKRSSPSMKKKGL